MYHREHIRKEKRTGKNKIKVKARERKILMKFITRFWNFDLVKMVDVKFKTILCVVFPW